MNGQPDTVEVAAAMLTCRGPLASRWGLACSQVGAVGAWVNVVSARLAAGDSFALALRAAGTDPSEVARADAVLRTGTVPGAPAPEGAAPLTGLVSRARPAMLTAGVLWLVAAAVGVRPLPLTVAVCALVVAACGYGWLLADRAVVACGSGAHAYRWLSGVSALSAAGRLSPAGFDDCGWSAAAAAMASGAGVSAALAAQGAPAHVCEAVSAGASWQTLSAAAARLQWSAQRKAEKLASSSLLACAAAATVALVGALAG